MLKEPTVVAINTKNKKIIAFGSEAYNMIGRTPGYIQIVKPLSGGVISDFAITCALIEHFLKKVVSGGLVRPCIIICVPGCVTSVEAGSVAKAAYGSGARKVFLIEESVAAAIGAGIDLTKPQGRMILDIGGGTSDAALLSLYGVVAKSSVRVAGENFDNAISCFMRREHSLFIGPRTAENMKMTIASASFSRCENICMTVKGIDIKSGLPKKKTIYRSEISRSIEEPITCIINTVRSVLESSPPELAGDLKRNGIILTGGGTLLHGLPDRLSKETGLKVILSDKPAECVSRGIVKAFRLTDALSQSLISFGRHEG